MGETELARMVVRLTGESVGYQRMLAEAQQTTVSTMQRIEAAVQATGVVAAIAMVVQKLEQYKQRVVNFFKEGFAAFSEAEEVMINLRAMLSANERDVDRLAERYQNFANKQIALLAVSDEQILTNLRMAESFGLTADRAEQAVLRATGLAKVAGSSTDSMMRLVAAMEKGDTKRAMMFARMVPQLRGIKDESEFIAKYNKLWAAGLEAVEKSAQTSAGRIKVLKEEWGNFMEEVGGVIAPMVLPFVEAARVGVEKLQEYMKPIFEWIKEQWKVVQEKTTAVFDYLRPIVVAWFGMWKAQWKFVYEVAELVWHNLYNAAEGFFKFAGSVLAEWFGEWEITWGDVQTILVDAFGVAEFAFTNWKILAVQALNEVHLKFVQVTESMVHWIRTRGQAAGRAWAQILRGEILGAPNTLLFDTPMRQLGEFERALTQVVTEGRENIANMWRNRDGGGSWDDDDLVEQGRHEEEKRNEGRMKEMQKFDAVLRQSAEARSRMQEYADRISRDRTERAQGQGGGQAADSRAAAVATQSVEARVRESNQLLRRVADNTQRIASQPQIIVEDADLA